MPKIPGTNAGGQIVWRFPDGTIVPFSVALNANGEIVAPSSPGATEDKQDVIIAEIEPVVDNPEFFEDTNFLVGDSPAIIDFNTALGRNATKGTIINDGPGDFTVAFSYNGLGFGDAIRMETQEQIDFEKVSVDSIQITWVANSAYRVVAI